MTQGPLAKVGTKVAKINTDVSRKLNWGRLSGLEFIVPDRTEVDGWRILLTMTKGYDRVSQDEKTDKDGSEVLIEVVDYDETLGLGSVLATTDLHLRVDGDIFKVGSTDPVAPNEAQVYLLKCKIRTKRTNFDTTKG